MKIIIPKTPDLEELIDSESFLDTNESQKSDTPESEKLELPYANSIYYKSIFGLISTLSVFGFMVGLYLMNIVFKRSQEMLRDYKKSPHKYTALSLKRVKTGRKIAWATLCIWIGEILAYLILF